MNTPTITGIVVALAVTVVAIVFLFPSLSPFAAQQPALSAADVAALEGQPSDADINGTTTPTTMTTIPDATQLQGSDEVVGTGPAIAPGDTVQIKYTGMLTNGTVFDSSDAHGGTPLTLIVGADGSLHTPDGGSLIQGWSQGVVGMKQGGKRKLIIPPSLGYGSQAVGNIIPANATLVFELTLVSVTPGK